MLFNGKSTRNEQMKNIEHCPTTHAPSKDSAFLPSPKGRRASCLDLGENLHRYLSGTPLLNLVQRELGY
jgi:hypothetical protein